MKGCDVVIHLAAIVGVPLSWEDPVECLDTNIIGTMNVIKAAKECGVGALVFASSAAIYDFHSSPYAYSKKAGEDLLTMYANDIASMSLRFFNVYGEGQNMAYASEAGMIRASVDLKNLVHDEFTILTVLRAAIEASPVIPEPDKVLAQDFLAESMNTLWDRAEDILAINIEQVPIGVVEHWDGIKETVKTLFL